MAGSAVSEDVLGAWIVKCNPAKWDLAGFVAEGGRVIRDWAVVSNYRSDMMRHGHRVLLWVTGSAEAPLPRGLWGSGWITGPVVDVYETPDWDELTDGVEVAAELADFWLDEDAGSRVNFVAPMRLEVWSNPVVEQEIAAISGLDQLEVIRMRQGSNPSWISKDQLRLLEPLLPAWPVVAPESGQVVTVGEAGAGYGDPVTRTIVEAAAIKVAEEHYRAAGYAVESVERDKVGWDLTCVSPDGRIARVEVKGLSGSKPVVLLTRNEYRSSQVDDGWVLAVVTQATSRPVVTTYSASTVRTTADPYVYRLDLARSLPT